MAADHELVPLKRVLEAVGVSRATLWRAAHSGIEGFPAPTIHRRRVYWRANEIEAVQQGLDAYQGRGEFDAKNDRVRAETRLRELVELKQAKPARRRGRKGRAKALQGDLFGR